MVNVIDVNYLMRVCNKEIKVNAVNRKRAMKKMQVLRKDNFECTICHRVNLLTIDHIKPVVEIKKERGSQACSSRWKNHLENCRVLCIDCHLARNKHGGMT
jgi:5-methylcytosine-specific restriction endonuclease McrA